MGIVAHSVDKGCRRRRILGTRVQPLRVESFASALEFCVLRVQSPQLGSTGREKHRPTDVQQIRRGKSGMEKYAEFISM
jgi:hypothetical protein